METLRTPEMTVTLGHLQWGPQIVYNFRKVTNSF